MTDDASIQISDDVKLCLSCGICCTGVLFSYAPLEVDEIELATGATSTIAELVAEPHQVENRLGLFAHHISVVQRPALEDRIQMGDHVLWSPKLA